MKTQNELRKELNEIKNIIDFEELGRIFDKDLRDKIRNEQIRRSNERLKKYEEENDKNANHSNDTTTCNRKWNQS